MLNPLRALVPKTSSRSQAVSLPEDQTHRLVHADLPVHKPLRPPRPDGGDRPWVCSDARPSPSSRTESTTDAPAVVVARKAPPTSCVPSPFAPRTTRLPSRFGGRLLALVCDIGGPAADTPEDVVVKETAPTISYPAATVSVLVESNNGSVAHLPAKFLLGAQLMYLMTLDFAK